MEFIVRATKRPQRPDDDQSQALNKICIYRLKASTGMVPAANNIPISNPLARLDAEQTCTICANVMPNLAALLLHLSHKHKPNALSCDKYERIRSDNLKLSVHPGDASSPLQCDLRLRNASKISTLLHVPHMYIMQDNKTWIVCFDQPLELAAGEQVLLQLGTVFIRSQSICTVVVQTQRADVAFIEWHVLPSCCPNQSVRMERSQLPRTAMDETLYRRVLDAKGVVLGDYFKTLQHQIAPLNCATYCEFFKLASQLSRIDDQLDLEDYHMPKASIQRQQTYVYQVQLPEDVLRFGCRLTMYDTVCLNFTNATEKKIELRLDIVFIFGDGRILFETRGPLNTSLTYDVHFERGAYIHDLEMMALQHLSMCEVLPMLFPKKMPDSDDAITPEAVPPLSWFRSDLNELQQQAVEHIVQGTAYPAPYILFGPPGTGKTKTLCEAILQLWRQKPTNRILVCGSSNAAADELALRMLDQVSAGCRFRHILYRLYAATFVSKPKTKNMRMLIDVSNERYAFALPGWPQLKQFPIVVCTLATAGSLLLWKDVKSTTFTHVFVDECGSATELHSLLPMAVCTQPGRIAAHVVLAGDPKQLGPVITSMNAKFLGNGSYGISMLERLTKTEMYAIQPNGEYDRNVITQLVQNYRSNAHIVQVPSDAFYDGKLLACGPRDRIDLFVNWAALPVADIPIIFHAVAGSTKRENDSTSMHNPAEVRLIVFYVMRLLCPQQPHGMRSAPTPRTLTQSDIGIISPYVLQCQKIRKALSGYGWKDIFVASVEKFQGSERPVILASMVRSGLVHGLGFLACPKRLNVMITRAESLLIMVGDPVKLMLDGHWRNVLRRYKQMQVCVGKGFVVPEEGRSRHAYGRKESTEKDRVTVDKPLPRDHPLQAVQIEKYLRFMRKTLGHREKMKNTAGGDLIARIESLSLVNRTKSSTVSKPLVASNLNDDASHLDENVSDLGDGASDLNDCDDFDLDDGTLNDNAFVLVDRAINLDNASELDENDFNLDVVDASDLNDGAFNLHDDASDLNDTAFDIDDRASNLDNASDLDGNASAG